ncbi:MAG: glycosyltransferase family 2 protein [Chthoniobacterales bacterium]
MKTPYFSVITPSFNQGNYLAACIDSIEQQGDNDYEQIIIDNCSTDKTLEILQQYAKKPQIKIICERDHGQSEAVNKGFRAARGEIICWLNSDDAYPEKTFQRLREIFSNPNKDVVFGDAHQVSYDGRNPERLKASFNHRHDFIRWWSSNVKLHQPALFFRRSVREEIGFLREDLHYAMDYEYWWRMAERYDFHYIPEELAIQHRQPDSKTIKAWHHVLEEREKVFAPFYWLLGSSEADLKKEKNSALAKHYLLQAYAAEDGAMVRFFLKRAFYYSPRKILRLSSLGLIKRLFS